MELAVNLLNVNVHKIKWHFGKMRLLGARLEQSKLFKSSSNSTFIITPKVQNSIELSSQRFIKGKQKLATISPVTRRGPKSNDDRD